MCYMLLSFYNVTSRCIMEKQLYFEGCTSAAYSNSSSENLQQLYGDRSVE